MQATLNIQGHCDPRFRAVQDAFKQNFDTYGEVGASISGGVSSSSARPIAAVVGNKRPTIRAIETRRRTSARGVLSSIISGGRSVADGPHVEQGLPSIRDLTRGLARSLHKPDTVFAR